LLIVYEDDSSRFIVGYGVYPTPTSKYSVDVLKKAIEKYGKPEEILSDHGTTFSMLLNQMKGRRGSGV